MKTSAIKDLAAKRWGKKRKGDVSYDELWSGLDHANVRELHQSAFLAGYRAAERRKRKATKRKGP